MTVSSSWASVQGNGEGKDNEETSTKSVIPWPSEKHVKKKKKKGETKAPKLEIKETKRRDKIPC